MWFTVRPRFPSSHITEIYTWAGKTRNITCHILAEPLPVIEWLHHGQALVNNETYRIYIMSKDTNLQVNIAVIAHLLVVVWNWCVAVETLLVKYGYKKSVQLMLSEKVTLCMSMINRQNQSLKCTLDCRATDYYTAIWWLVHWPLMGWLWYLVQQGGAYSGCGLAHLPPRCTKCKSPPINDQCTNFILFNCGTTITSAL